MNGFRLALAFLTRLPGGAHPDDSAAVSRGVAWFPAVGAVVGSIVAIVYVALDAVVPATTAAALAVGAAAVVTGALHEDGFADSLDALSGGRDAQHRLEILRDSRHGTFGVLGLVVLTLVKVSALASLDGSAAAAALIAAGALGRGGAVGVMGWAHPASGEGLGASYLRSLRRQDVIAGLGLALLVGVLSLGAVVAVAAALASAGAVVVALWARRRIGGVTGDVLGAAEQVGECVVLVLMSALAPEAVWFA